MKKLLFFLSLLILTIAGYAQGDFRSLRITQQFIPPRLSDTPSIPFPLGSLMIRSIDNTMWIRSTTQWVNISGGAGQSLLFSNGLANTAGNVGLGAPLTRHTTVGGGNYDLNLGDGSNPLGNVSITSNSGAYINAFQGSGTNSGYFEVTPYGFQLNAFRGGISRSLKIDTGGIIFRKNGFAPVAKIRDMPRTMEAFPAVVYDTITKEFKYNYISGNTSPAFTFSNGLTNDGSGNVRLGGTLTTTTNLRVGSGMYFNFFNSYNSPMVTFSDYYLLHTLGRSATTLTQDGFEIKAAQGTTTHKVLIDTAGLRLYRNDVPVANIRDIPRTTAALPVVVYDTLTKELKHSYISSSGVSKYIFGNGLMDDGSGNVGLGGSITRNSNISLGATGSFSLRSSTNGDIINLSESNVYHRIGNATTNLTALGFVTNASQSQTSQKMTIDTAGWRLDRNNVTVATIRSMPRTTEAFPAVVYDTLSKEFKYNYLSANGSANPWNNLPEISNAVSPTIANATAVFVYNNSTTTANSTITLPANPANGQPVEIHFISAVTNLNIAPNSGQAIIQSYTPTYVSAGEHLTYRWVQAISKWVSNN